jgi:hypothetical protein
VRLAPDPTTSTQIEPCSLVLDYSSTQSIAIHEPQILCGPSLGSCSKEICVTVDQHFRKKLCFYGCGRPAAPFFHDPKVASRHCRTNQSKTAVDYRHSA